MFGIGKKSINSPATTTYLFFCILLINQFLIAHSFRLMHDESDQSGNDDVQRAVIHRLALGDVGNTDGSSFNRKYSRSSDDLIVRRRFCCMNPLSGRKRSARDLARQKIVGQHA